MPPRHIHHLSHLSNGPEGNCTVELVLDGNRETDVTVELQQGGDKTVHLGIFLT
jgi:hypothetical protein